MKSLLDQSRCSIGCFDARIHRDLCQLIKKHSAVAMNAACAKAIKREVLQLCRSDLIGWFDAPAHAFGFGSFQVAAIRAGGHSLGRGLVPAFFTFIP